MVITCLIFCRPGGLVPAAGDWRPGDSAGGTAEGCVTCGAETQAASTTASRLMERASGKSRRRPLPAPTACSLPGDAATLPAQRRMPELAAMPASREDQPGTLQLTQPTPYGQEPPGKNPGTRTWHPSP